MSSRDFYVQPCQPYSGAYPIGSRLSSLTEWRRLSRLLRPSSRSVESASASAAAAVGSLDSSTVEAVEAGLKKSELESEAAASADPVTDPPLLAGSTLPANFENESTSQTATPRLDIQENEPLTAASNQENNQIPSSPDPAVVVSSASPNVDSVHSLRLGELTGEDGVTSVENLSSSGIIDSVSESADESIQSTVPNTGVDGDLLRIPSAVYGVQIQSPGLLGAQFLGEAFVPMLFATQSSSLNSASNLRSATTEESFTTISSGVGESDGSTDSSGSSSVIEILATLNTGARRFEDEYVRPYYDLSVRPRIKKQFGRIDDDPSIE